MTRNKYLVLNRFLRNRTGVIGLLLVIILAAFAIFAKFLAPYDPLKLFPAIMAPPSAEFWLGTDALGRCLFSRIIYGGQVSFGISFGAISISTVVGIILGINAAYYGGWVSTIIMRGMDIVLSFPAIVLALGIIAILGPSMTNLVLTIGILYTPQFVRIVNGSALSAKQNDYVMAIKVAGASDLRVLALHILPNIVAPIIVQVSLTLSTAILAESALSFLGFGVQPPTPSWGVMISESQVMMYDAPWLAIFPGIAIALLVIGFNLLGDGIRDAMDQMLN